MAKVVETTANDRHNIGQGSMTVTADVPYMLGQFIKPITGGGAATRYPVLYISNGISTGGKRAAATFDLDACKVLTAVVTNTAYTPVIHGKGIHKLNDGWYFIWLAADIGEADTSIGYWLSWADDFAAKDVGDSYAGDGLSGFWLGGRQIEVNRTYPGRYIPTGATAVKTVDYLKSVLGVP